MTDFRTDIRRGWLITAVLAVLCSAFLVLPASADPLPFDDCPQEQFCLYTGSAGSGTRTTIAADGKDENHTGTPLSAKNNTPLWACLYNGAQYGGSLHTVRPNSSGELVTDGVPWVVASYKLVPTSALCFTGYERCPDNRVCTFTEPNGRGATTVHRPATDPATQNYGNSYGTGPAPRSAWNRTTKHVCFYPEPTYTGTWADPADSTGVKKFGAYVVLRGDSTTIPAPFSGTFRSHELVNGTVECQ
ncbi:peptidase inhibitor family I36 protein [Streptomyces sp. NPDC055103]